MPEQKYPVKVGSAVLPEFRRQQFKDEVHEFLVASGDSGITSVAVQSGGICANMPILGAVDLTCGTSEKGRTILMWDPTPEEQQNGSYKKLLHEYTVYRVKGHPPVKPWYTSPAVRMGGMYLTEILEAGVSDLFLQQLIAEYKESLFLRSELLGTLALEDEGYTGSFDWPGGRIKVTVSVEYTPYTNPLRHLEDFCRKCERHDRELRQYAAEKLENGREITGKMKLTEIVMYYDGDYDTYFTYDKYTINISGGTKGADYIWMGAG